jgi:phosphoglycolate phosphatase
VGVAEQHAGPTVGFDLDMTLLDARPGIVRTLGAVGTEFDMELDGDYVAANLGPPMPDLLRGLGLESPLVERLAARYLELYPSIAIESAVAMPGAGEALAAVRAVGGRTLVVTGKYEPNAALHIKALGWDVDHLSGDVFASGKGNVLRAEGASIYVGDHVGDVVGAKAAGAVAVAVPTGPFDADALRDAGADVVLGDLTEFPDWLAAR